MQLGNTVRPQGITVVREIFAYRNFHVLKFHVKKFSDIVYLSEKILRRNFKYE